MCNTVTERIIRNVSRYILHETVINNPDKHWDFNTMSSNPNISLEIIERHPEKPWNWDEINKHIPITIDIID